MLTFEAIDELLEEANKAASKLCRSGDPHTATCLRAACRRVNRELEDERCVLTTVGDDASGL